MKRIDCGTEGSGCRYNIGLILCGYPEGWDGYKPWAVWMRREDGPCIRAREGVGDWHIWEARGWGTEVAWIDRYLVDIEIGVD